MLEEEPNRRPRRRGRLFRRDRLSEPCRPPVDAPGLGVLRRLGGRRHVHRQRTAEKLRYAQHLMADLSRSIPDVCRERGGIPTSTLYQHVAADGSPKEPSAHWITVRPRRPGNPDVASPPAVVAVLFHGSRNGSYCNRLPCDGCYEGWRWAATAQSPKPSRLEGLA